MVFWGVKLVKSLKNQWLQKHGKTGEKLIVFWAMKNSTLVCGPKTNPTPWTTLVLGPGREPTPWTSLVLGPMTKVDAEGVRAVRGWVVRVRGWGGGEVAQGMEAGGAVGGPPTNPFQIHQPMHSAIHAYIHPSIHLLNHSPIQCPLAHIPPSIGPSLNSH